MTEKEAIEKATKLIRRYDNMRILGARGEWSGNSRQGFMFNPQRGGGSLGGGVTPPPVCPEVETVTVTLSGITFDCGCVEFPETNTSFEGVDGDPFDPGSPGVNDTYVLSVTALPNIWTLDVFNRMAVYNWGNSTCLGDPDGVTIGPSVVAAICNPTDGIPGWVVTFNHGSGFGAFDAEGIFDPTVAFANQNVCKEFNGIFGNRGIATGGTAIVSF